MRTLGTQLLPPAVAPAPLFASSPAMGLVEQLLQSAASTPGSVLIVGEPGSGRETVARAIHALLPDAGRPFVVVDCVQASGQPLDVELFGEGRPARRESGGRPGLEQLSPESALGQSLGGTLFLKNLPAASSRLQARLARLLRDRSARDPRTLAPFPVEFRLIAAMDPVRRGAAAIAPIQSELDEQFAVRIDVPPLRKRREDIPALAAWLLERWCRNARVPAKTLAPSAVALMMALPWTGNANELRGFLEAVASHVSGPQISAEQFLAHIRLESGALAAYRLPLREARRRFEREYISAVLEQHHGRIGHAAEMLGIGRTNLYRKLRELRLGRAGIRTDTETRRRA